MCPDATLSQYLWNLISSPSKPASNLLTRSWNGSHESWTKTATAFSWLPRRFSFRLSILEILATGSRQPSKQRFNSTFVDLENNYIAFLLMPDCFPCASLFSNPSHFLSSYTPVVTGMGWAGTGAGACTPTVPLDLDGIQNPNTVDKRIDA